MTLSPLEIRKQIFKNSMFGYNKNEVDLFKESVEETVNELLIENEKLNSKIKELQSRITNLENQASGIQEAIELANKEGERIKEAATQQAESMIRKAQQMIENTESELDHKLNYKKEELYGLQTFKDNFKQKLLYLFEEQRKLIERFEQEHHSRKVKELLSGMKEEEIVENPLPIFTVLKNSKHLRNRLIF
ncbi:DivIVA domain-containing protein [bacterium]|nr:DivIVA domain-containing protein [bacterium]